MYPTIEPYATGFLDSTDGHRIYWEKVGNPDGKPALFLHGGPGSGCNPNQRQLFNPKIYNVLLFDQRGCGLSTPHASLSNNTTWELVKDVERLRQEILEAERMLLLGGSWGSTLALAYAQTHPNHVSELIIRGIFTGRQQELNWLYRGQGANYLFPDHWQKFVEPIPVAEQYDLITAYHKHLTADDSNEILRFARCWSRWEHQIITLLPSPQYQPTRGSDIADIAFARIENHYFMHQCFLEEAQLIQQAQILKDIPGIIIQGRYDICTPFKTAWELHQAWPQAAFRVVNDAGHSMNEPGICRALIAATDHFAMPQT